MPSFDKVHYKLHATADRDITRIYDVTQSTAFTSSSPRSHLVTIVTLSNITASFSAILRAERSSLNCQMTFGENATNCRKETGLLLPEGSASLPAKY